MLLHYEGKRRYIANDFCHVRYAFSVENDHICDVKDDVAARQLIASGDYMPVLDKVFEPGPVKVDPIAEELGKLNDPVEEPEKVEEEPVADERPHTEEEKKLVEEKEKKSTLNATKAEDIKPKKSKESLKCSICGRVCKSALGLRAHMRAHEK